MDKEGGAQASGRERRPPGTAFSSEGRPAAKPAGRPFGPGPLSLYNVPALGMDSIGLFRDLLVLSFHPTSLPRHTLSVAGFEARNAGNAAGQSERAAGGPRGGPRRVLAVYRDQRLRGKFPVSPPPGEAAGS